jgi:hypothetical protein
MLKRIGDGSSVSICRDPWIPGIMTMTPSAQIGRNELNWVYDLIDSENGTWKIDLVRKNFIAPEADAILNIPLRRGGGDDFWA